MAPFIAAYQGVPKEGVSHLEANDLPDPGIRISTGRPAVAARKRAPGTQSGCSSHPSDRAGSVELLIIVWIESVPG